MAVAFRRLAAVGLHAQAARSSTSRSPTRRTSAPGAPTGSLEHERDAVYADYVVTEAGGFQMPTADGPRLPVIVGEKGTYWSKHHGARHARATRRSRSAPTTRSSPRPRWCAASPSTGPPTQIHEHVAPLRRGPRLRPEMNAALLEPRRLRRRSAELPLGLAPHRARVHAHDVRADGRARRHEDQRDPGPGRARGRHPHAARPDAATTRARCSRGARRPRRQGRDRVERRPRRPRRRSTRRCGTRSAA